jgi:hypothetical protein
MSNLTGRNFLGATAVMAGGITGRQRVVGAELLGRIEALHVIAGVIAISTLLPVFVRPPQTGKTNIEIDRVLSRKRRV